MSVQFKVQLVVVADDGSERTAEVIVLNQEQERLEQRGLTLAEGKHLLREVQRRVVPPPATAWLAAKRACPTGGRERTIQAHQLLSLRTLFGRITLARPRVRPCGRQADEAASSSPLTRRLSERRTPARQDLATRWASLVSSGLTVRARQDFLPVDEERNVSTVRRTALDVARRCEAELGPEQPLFIAGGQAEWDELPRPDLPLTVGLDGGYVHSRQQRSKREGWCEVIAGKRQPAEGPTKCFGCVPTYDTQPKRRLCAVLRAQGRPPNQQVTCLTDGGEDVRDLPLDLTPPAEPLLDWFHITLRLTVMTQLAKGLSARDNPALATEVAEELERLKWFVWHGKVFRALQVVEELELALDLEPATQEQRQLLQAVTEFGGESRAKASGIPNYGERHRNGEAISRAFVESAVNQVVSQRMVKQQHRRWTPEGAHLLLQTRTRTLNGELAATFRSWYPAFTLADRPVTDELPAAAAA